MRRKVIAASLAACFAAVLCMGTWALFTATGTATNVVTVGDVSIRLVEDFDELGAQGIGLCRTEHMFLGDSEEGLCGKRRL